MPFVTRLEPDALVRHFLAHPPQGFAAGTSVEAMPAFTAPFDLLTTAEPALLRRLERWPGYRHWRRWLRLRTRFIGATNTEYLWLPDADPAALARRLREDEGDACALLIVKDIPSQTPLLSAAANALARDFLGACEREGFVVVEGQALAWVAIDFASNDEYLARQSRSRRRDLRRKLRSRADLDVETLETGADFASDALIEAFYALYLGVYAQSELHFDLLGLDYFRAVLRDGDSGGVVFVYRHRGEMIGWNLCYECDGRLIDKYIGLAYPQSREHNLYTVSWFENLDYARRRGLDAYVAGWTDPQAKRALGARFSFTRHAVYARSPALRALLRRLAPLFESDRSLLAENTSDDADHC
ncbi:peptidogalycan biosysnthesis protein [Lysobacter capsici]|uniref:peptidogalycan biosysnthesis protein n=1 Tax=Lysobacter capsici TaxID=435897 RepID=UPI001C000643|nr:GNAT family N-acetyltransferase [Lysobacter capsici]QWF17535.1 N-acetyltransferase [Lysobacter capsici]